MLSRIRYLDGAWAIGIALALALALAACGGSSAPVEEEIEAGGIDVTEITLSGATGSGRGLALTFPEAMDRASVEESITMIVGGPVASLVASPLLASWTVEPDYIWDPDSKRVRLFPVPYCREVDLSLAAGYKTAEGVEGEALDLKAQTGRNRYDFAYDADSVDGMPMCGSTIFFNDGYDGMLYALTGTQVRYKYNGDVALPDLAGKDDVWQHAGAIGRIAPMGRISGDGGSTMAAGFEDGSVGFFHGYDLSDTRPVSNVGTDLSKIGGINSISDVNGDGVEDWAARDLELPELKSISGILTSYYIFGPASFADELLGDVEVIPIADAAYVEDYPTSYKICGAAMGNFNGDMNEATGHPYGDVLACLDYRSTPAGYAEQEIWILSGGDAPEPDPKSGSLIHNSPVRSGYQIPLSGAIAAPDANGDETDDLVVPVGLVEVELSSISKEFETPSYTSVGALVVLKGADDPIDVSLADAAATEIVYKSANLLNIMGVMDPGDIDGDGREDFIVAVKDTLQASKAKEADYYLFGFLGREDWPERIQIDLGAEDPLARGFDFAIVLPGGFWDTGNIALGFEAIGNVDNDESDDVLIRGFWSGGTLYDLLYFGSDEMKGGVILEMEDADAKFEYTSVI